MSDKDSWHLQDAADEKAFEEDLEEAVVEVEEGREEPESGGQHCC